jgi:hypothetical protein
MRARLIAVAVVSALLGIYLADSLAWGQARRSVADDRSAVDDPEKEAATASTSAGSAVAVAASETVTLPDNSTGNILFTFHPGNNKIQLFQTIPDSTGRGMKTKVTEWNWGSTVNPPLGYPFTGR